MSEGYTSFPISTCAVLTRGFTAKPPWFLKLCHTMRWFAVRSKDVTDDGWHSVAPFALCTCRALTSSWKADRRASSSCVVEWMLAGYSDVERDQQMPL